MFDLHGKVALVTGARRGMGKAQAIAFAKQGATVVVTDIDKAACDDVVTAIVQGGGTAQCFKMDITKLDEITHVFDSIIEQFKQLDILVNNAGIFKPVMSADITEAEWDQMFAVNIKGAFFCAQRAAKEMSKQQWGRIITIGSVASGGVGIGIQGGVHYSATKGGIVAMTESLACELASQGITVNCIAPGAIDTPMIDDAGMTQEALHTLLKKVPLGRMGKPEEIAAPVVFFASEEASYITGATLYVDGGWLAS